MEPVYGGRVDTAVPVRVGSAAGLAQSVHADAAVAAAELLADPEWDARAGAARALGVCRRDTAEPVLRYKLLTGDAEAAVLGECMRALLSMAPDAVPLVAERLADASDAVAEQAALALGESRLDAAFDALRGYLEAEPTRARRRPALVGLALLRRDAAIDYLIGLIAEADGVTAVHAAEALDIYKHDPKMAERIRAAQKRRR
jgi:HEAT repeat protein